MRLDYMFNGFVVFAVVIVAGVILIGDLDTSYDDVNMTGANDSFADVFSDISTLHNFSNSVTDDVIDAPIEESTSWESMLTGAYSAVRIVPKIFTLFSSITNAIALEIGGIDCKPQGAGGAVCIFIDFAFISFVISIIFAIIYMMFRFIPK